MSKEAPSASVSQTHTLYLTILFHFLSHHGWLRSSVFPQFHLHCSHADALRPQTHANTHREKHNTYWFTHAHLCAQAYSSPTKPLSPETYTSLMFCVFCWSGLWSLVASLIPHCMLKLSQDHFIVVSVSLLFIFLLHQTFLFLGSINTYFYFVTKYRNIFKKYLYSKVFLLSLHCACETH